MNDLIYRQAAIEKVEMLFKTLSKEYVDMMGIGYNHAVSDSLAILKNLPSAEPEITRCHECAKRRTLDCPMGITVFDAPPSDGYCYKAERRTDG